MTASMGLAAGESFPGEDQALFDEFHPRALVVGVWTRARRSERLRASRSMLCATRMSRSRTNRSNSVSSRQAVSRPEALSVKAQPGTWPSSWRFSFRSSVLTRTYPIRQLGV